MDVYRVKVGDGVAERITNTPGWTEKQPQITRTGRLIYNSDKNGIQNIYEHNLETGEAFPLTDLQTGISQHSISGDGSRIAFSSINEGYLDIFLLKTPFARKKKLSYLIIIGLKDVLRNHNRYEYRLPFMLKKCMHKA